MKPIAATLLVLLCPVPQVASAHALTDDAASGALSRLVASDDSESAPELDGSNAEPTVGAAAADDALLSSLRSPARQDAARVFFEQRRAEQPAAHFALATEPEEGGNYAELTIWLSEPDAECADSLWQVTLIDIDSGVTALHRADRVGRLCCAASCERTPEDWMLALNTLRESDPEIAAQMVHPVRGVTTVALVGEGEVHTPEEVSLHPSIIPSWDYQHAEVACVGTGDGFGCTAMWNGTRVGIEWASHEGTPYVVAVEVIEWE